MWQFPHLHSLLSLVQFSILFLFSLNLPAHSDSHLDNFINLFIPSRKEEAKGSHGIFIIDSNRQLSIMDNFIDKGTYFLLLSWQVAQQTELLYNIFSPKITKHFSSFASLEFEKEFPLMAGLENTLQTLFLGYSEMLFQEFPTSSWYKII